MKLEDTISKAVLIFGLSVNTLGLVSSSLMKDIPCLIATAICLAMNIGLGVYFFRIKKPTYFTNIAMVITGCFLFPFIQMNSNYPEQAVLYQFILPVSFSLMTKSWPLYACLAINSTFNYINFERHYPGTGLLVCAIYLGVQYYISVIVKLYKRYFFRDYQELETLKEKYSKLAKYDRLTGLKNRLGLEEALDPQKKYFTIIVDIDHFKKYNDTYGHDQGDLILRAIADILKLFCSENFLVSRFGGEEFVCLSSLNLENTVKLCESIRQYIGVEMTAYNLTVSMGISSLDYPTDKAFKEADINLYKAKDLGRNQIHY